MTTFEVARQRAAIAVVKKAVAFAFGYSVREIDSRMRDEPLTAARHAAMVIARRLTEASYPDLAREFKRSNHQSLRHAVKANDRRRSRDKAFAEKVDSLQEILAFRLEQQKEGPQCQTPSLKI